MSISSVSLAFIDRELKHRCIRAVMDDSSVDLILEAAVLIDRKTNIKRKEGTLQSIPFNCHLYMLY